MNRPSYSADEIASRGEDIYKKQLKSTIESVTENNGKVLVIDILTGDYEIDADHVTAAHKARAKNPNGLLYALRVGYPALGRIGGHFRPYYN